MYDTNNEGDTMATVKLRKDRAVTIPEAILERLGITAGEEFELLEHEKGIMLVPRKDMSEGDEWEGRRARPRPGVMIRFWQIVDRGLENLLLQGDRPRPHCTHRR